MKRKTGIYLLLLLLWWMMGCDEFKKPTMPSLPARWNSKLIIPLLDKTYSFAELICDSDTTLSIRDSVGNLYYTAEDSSEKTITADSSFFNKILADRSIEYIDCKAMIDVHLGDSIPLIQKVISIPLDTSYNKINYARFKDESNSSMNSIKVKATLNDTLTSDVNIKIVCENIKKDNISNELLADSMTISQDNNFGELIFYFANSLLVNNQPENYLDSLKFSVSIQIDDTLSNDLDYGVTLEIIQEEFELESFYGIVYAGDFLPPQVLINSPVGIDSVFFDTAGIIFNIEGQIDRYEKLEVYITGIKDNFNNRTTDASFVLNSTQHFIDIKNIMLNLPDSIKIFVKGISKRSEYSSTSDIVNNCFDVNYQLYVPFRFNLPSKIEFSSANIDTFFINDSLTRTNIVRSQNGAVFDIEIENRTPFQGNIQLLISNDKYFFSDLEDTTEIIIDTLATIKIIPAEIAADGTVQSPRYSYEFPSADSGTIALLANTCYILPKFFLTNPDTSQILYLRSDYSISLKIYLNLLFDPSVLNQTVTDTTDTTG